MTPEGKVKAQVSKRLKPIAHLWSFMPVQMGLGKAVLDYLLCIGGKFVAIETKAKGKKLTTRQEHTKAELEAAGAAVFIVDDNASLARAIDYIQRISNAVQKPNTSSREPQTMEETSPRLSSPVGTISEGSAISTASKVEK